ncbi:MAG: hypothetical protein AB1546_09235 [bacterium]
MKEKIDSEKILRHIKYTRHWLDKANSDFAEKKFASGSTILSLARAELTAAWEEALQLKSRIVGKLPARSNRLYWGAASSVSMLASGFIIAVIIIQFTSNPVPRTKSMQPLPESAGVTSTVTPQQPVASKTVEPTAEPQKIISTTPAPRRQYLRIKETAITAPTPQPEPVPQIEPVLPQLEPTAVETKPAPEPVKILPQTEIIELYKTAEKSLKD